MSEKDFEKLHDKSNRMTKNWRELEILIGIVLSIVALFAFWLTYSMLIFYLDLSEKYSNYVGSEFSWFKFFKMYLLLAIMGFAMLIGGFFMIFEKKFAWICCVVSCFYGFVFFASLYTGIKDSVSIWILHAFNIFFLLILTAILSNPFRRKYRVQKRDWIIILSCFVLFVIDKFLI